MRRRLFNIAGSASAATGFHLGYKYELKKAHETYLDPIRLCIEQKQHMTNPMPMVYAEDGELAREIQGLRQRQIRVLLPCIGAAKVNKQELKYEDHLVIYDLDKKVPFFVFEHLTPEKYNRTEELERPDLEEDCRVQPNGRSSPDDYTHPDYVKGAFALACSHAFDSRAYRDTYKMTNVFPKHKLLSDCDSVWGLVEAHARSLAFKHNSVYVISGPMYQICKGKIKWIGANRVGVPTHLFKIIIVENKKGFDVYSYVVPNSKKASCHRTGSTEEIISDFLRSPRDIEESIGFKFFDSFRCCRLM